MGPSASDEVMGWSPHEEARALLAPSSPARTQDGGLTRTCPRQHPDGRCPASAVGIELCCGALLELPVTLFIHIVFEGQWGARPCSPQGGQQLGEQTCTVQAKGTRGPVPPVLAAQVTGGPLSPGRRAAPGAQGSLPICARADSLSPQALAPGLAPFTVLQIAMICVAEGAGGGQRGNECLICFPQRLRLLQPDALPPTKTPAHRLAALRVQQMNQLCLCDEPLLGGRLNSFRGWRNGADRAASGTAPMPP